MVIWSIVVLGILCAFLKSCLSSRDSTNPRTTGHGPPAPRGGGGTGGWFSDRPDTHDDPPPPYSGPNPKPTNTNQARPDEGWRPGFWTGAALGGLGTYFMNGRQQQQQQRRGYQPEYDWERSWRPGTTSSTNWGGFGGGGASRRRGGGDEDRGEGSSSGLGAMRSSMGFGGSNVR